MIKKIFRQMLLTQILSAMTVTICMLVDSIMIGRFLGVHAMTAYGLASPVLLVFAAVGSMISAGTQVVCGKTLGHGDKVMTDSCYSVTLITTAVVSAAGVIAVVFFTAPIARLLGAVEGTLVFDLTKDYLRGFIIGAPVFISCQVMVPYIQMAGKQPRLITAVALMTVGDIIFDLINVILVKNAGFTKGMLGMGLASSLSYYIAFFIGAAYFLSKSSTFHFKAKLLNFRMLGDLVRAGIPTVINQLCLVFVVYVLNQILIGVGGNISVAAYSIISTVGNLCYAVGSGTGSVSLMLSSIFYADADKTAMRELIRTMTFYAAVLNIGVTIVVLIFATPLVSLFLTEENRHARGLAIFGMRLFCLSMLPSGLNTAFKNFYQGIDHVHFSETISIFQNFAFTALFSFILSRFFGTTGVWLGFVCGETLTLIGLVCYVFYKSRTTKICTDTFMLLPDDFGAKDEDCLELSVRSSEDMPNVLDTVGEFCIAHGETKKFSIHITLCIEEMVNNIIQHGFIRDKREHFIEIRIVKTAEKFFIRIRDNCIGFDPVKYLELHKNDDRMSHIGIRMVMSTVKSANYVNSLGLNNLTLTI